MKQIRICDVTMKQATEEFSLSFKEKIELAKLLDKLGVSVTLCVSNPSLPLLQVASWQFPFS